MRPYEVPTKSFMYPPDRRGGVRSRGLLVGLLAAALLLSGCLGALEDAASGNDSLAPQGDTSTPPNGSDGPGDDGQAENRSGADEDADQADPGRDGNRTNQTPERSHPPWPDISEASVRPGVQIRSSAGQCTTNFLFRTPDNATLMLGVAAHCFAEEPDAGSGCDPATKPMAPGAEATITGASNPGTLVYSSWWTMQEANATGNELCNVNDFALVALHPGDRSGVHPAALGFGGPASLAQGSPGSGEKVIWWGNSGTRPDGEATQRNEGYIVHSSPRSAVMYSASPGVPGDSGSGIQTADGQAVGVLSTVRLAPEPGSNGIVLLEPALAYAAEHGVHVELVTWQQLDQGRLP